MSDDLAEKDFDTLLEEDPYLLLQKLKKPPEIDRNKMEERAEMFASLDKIIDIMKEEEEKKVDIEEVVQLLALLPFGKRWLFLYTHSYLIRPYFGRSKKNYPKEELEKYAKLLEVEKITEEDTREACLNGDYDSEYGEVLLQIIRSGRFKLFLKNYPLIILRVKSMKTQ